jgi:ribonuclease G
MASVPIEKQVFEGQALMVQVIKDPIGTKGARLSRRRSASPAACWCSCRRTTTSACRRRYRPDQRERCVAPALVQARTGDMGGGFILRTNGEDASDAELAEDIAYLRKTWARIKDASLRLPPASLLHQDLNLLQRVLRDLVVEETQTIRIDSREQFEKLQAFGWSSCRQAERSCSCTRASGRSSTCSTSTRKSPRRWAGAST